MRKRNSLSYETVKSLFEETPEAASGDSYFKVSGGASNPMVVPIPTSVMHRLFRLGQAYGFRQLRYFEPEVKIIVGTVELPEFVRDLRRLCDLVNDEVLHDYINRLLAAVESSPGLSAKTVAVSTGVYFEKSA